MYLSAKDLDMLEITKTPEILIGSTGFTSKWVCTDAPVEFYAQRKDNLIGSTANNGGKVQINLSTSNALFYLSVGEFISVHKAGGGYHIASVLSKQSDTQYTLNLDYNAAYDFKFYVAYFKDVNYYVDVKLSINGVEQSNLAKFTPLQSGLTICDISGYLQTYVSDEKQSAINVTNIKESSQSGKFTVAFRENYIGNTSTDFIVNPNIWYYAKGTRSIEKGSNLAEFVPNLGASCKFLNYFDKPTVYPGLPFDISFLYSELIAGKSVQIIEEHYNSENLLLSTQTKVVDATQIGGLNSLLINVNALEATASYAKFKLVTDDATPPVETNTWYITTDPFTPSFPLKFVKSGTTVTLSGQHKGSYGTPQLPDIVLTPLANYTINNSYTGLIGNFLGGETPRFLWEFDILQSEFAKFTANTDFSVMLCSGKNNGKYAVANRTFVKANIPTWIEFIAELKLLFDDAKANINTQLNATEVRTAIRSTALGGDVLTVDSTTQTELMCLLWYNSPLSIGVSAGAAAVNRIQEPTNAFNFTFKVGVIKTDGTTQFNTIRNLGVNMVQGLPVITPPQYTTA